MANSYVICDSITNDCVQVSPATFLNSLETDLNGLGLSLVSNDGITQVLQSLTNIDPVNVGLIIGGYLVFWISGAGLKLTVSTMRRV